MPQKPLSKAQLGKIAKGKLTGKDRKTIAKEARVSESTISHIENNLGYKCLMRELAEGHHARLSHLFGKVVGGIETDLDQGKDLKERQSVRAEAVRLISLADGVVRPEDGEGQAQYTLTELLISYRQAQQREE